MPAEKTYDVTIAKQRIDEEIERRQKEIAELKQNRDLLDTHGEVVLSLMNAVKAFGRVTPKQSPKTAAMVNLDDKDLATMRTSKLVLTLLNAAGSPHTAELMRELIKEKTGRDLTTSAVLQVFHKLVHKHAIRKLKKGLYAPLDSPNGADVAAAALALHNGQKKNGNGKKQGTNAKAMFAALRDVIATVAKEMKKEGVELTSKEFEQRLRDAGAVSAGKDLKAAAVRVIGKNPKFNGARIKISGHAQGIRYSAV